MYWPIESRSRVSRLERARSAASAESAAISSAVLLAEPVSQATMNAAPIPVRSAELSFIGSPFANDNRETGVTASKA